MYYSRPSDNQAASAIITSSNALAYVDEGLDRLVDLDPASAMSFVPNVLSVWEVIFNFTGVTTYSPIEWALVFGTNWCQNAGGTRSARWEINTTDSWGSPAFTKTITMPTLSRYPVCLGADLSTLVGYNTTHRFLRLVLTDSVTLALPPRYGEIWLGDRREVPSLTIGWEGTPKHPAVVHKTPHLRRVSYSHEVRESLISGYNYYNPTEWEALRSLNEDAKGEAVPFPLHMGDDEEPLLVCLTKFQRFRTSSDLHAVQMEFTELVNDLVP